MASFTPTIVLVTGASTGIGRSLVLEFASNPEFKVYATMRNPSKWDVEPKENIITSALDVTSDKSVNVAVKDIMDKEGRIDILVNNAGIALGGSVETVLIEEAKNVFEVNVWGVVRVLQAVLPGMRKRRSGYVINISSTAGIRGFPAGDFYVGSKFALEGITESLRYTLAPYNIFMTNINPGPVKTPIGDKFMEESGVGSRVPEDADDHNFLGFITKATQSNLGKAIRDDGPSSEDLAKIILNLVRKKQEAKQINDVPFHVPNSEYAQTVLDQTRVHPTGWGGPNDVTLKAMPPLSIVAPK